MKVKHLLFAALAATVSFASCDNEAEDTFVQNGENAPKSVTVTIANQKNVSGGRSIAEALTGEDTPVAKAEELVALFADESGKILETRSLADIANSENITVSGSKYTFHLVDGNTKKVAFTNASNTAAAVDGTLAAAMAAQNNLANQNKTGKLNEILVYGESTQFTLIGDDVHNDNGVDKTSNLYSAGTVEVKPAVARIEITNFECTNLGGTTAGEDGLLPLYEAVSIDKFGINKTLSAIGGSIFDYKTDVNAFIAQTDWTANTFADGSLINFTKEAMKDTRVLAFNVAPGVVPQLIAKVPSVTKNSAITQDMQFTMPYFIKTKEDGGFVQNGTTISSLTAGSIYQVNFTFATQNVRPWFPTEEICVEVTVTIPNWTIVAELKPEFD